MVRLMLSRWFGLITLGFLALGPGLFWSPSAKIAGHSAGWAAVPLPGIILEAKSKLVSFSETLSLAVFTPLVRLLVAPVWNTLRTYQTPCLGQRLYLVYSRLQTDGG